MKRFATIAAVLATAVLGAVPATAGTRSVHPQVFSGKEIVSQASTPLCADADGFTNDFVLGKHCAGGNNQLFSTTADNICGGSNLVTSSCPFTLGLGLNIQFFGYPIVKVSNDHYGTLWQCAVKTCSVNQVNGGSGTAWVVGFGTCDSQGGCSFVSVAGSNDLNTANHWVQACSEGGGIALQVENTPSVSTGRCFWKSN